MLQFSRSFVYLYVWRIELKKRVNDQIYHVHDVPWLFKLKWDCRKLWLTTATTIFATIRFTQQTKHCLPVVNFFSDSANTHNGKSEIRLKHFIGIWLLWKHHLSQRLFL